MMSLAKCSTVLMLVLACNATPAAAQAPPRRQKAPVRKAEPPVDPLELQLRQAQDAVDNKDYAAAVLLLQSYLAQRPEDATAHFQLGYAYSALERWEEATSEYGRAVGLNPKLVAAQLNLGLILVERDPAAAVEPLRQAAELLPDQSRPRLLLGLALERSGNLTGAIEQYQAAESLDAKDYEVHFALGRALLLTGRPAEAEARFREALALHSDSAPARLGLANSLLAQKNLEGAAEELKSYVAREPQDRTARLQLAAILSELKRNDQALEELDHADANVPPSLESYKLRANLYLLQKQLTPAAETLQKALQLAPQDAALHGWLGRLWLEKRDFAPAERELRQALQLDASLTDSLRDLLTVYYLAEKYRAALDALDLLARRETPNAGSWFVRATCYDKLERKAEALAAYEKFLALDQGHNEVHEIQARQRVRLLTRELQQKKR